MRVFSFASGPAAMPRRVIEAVREDIAEWRGSGQSLLELPFTGREFSSILNGAEQDLRALLKLPDSYHVLFLQGGALTQFSTVPMNLLGTRQVVDYVETGYWSRRAIAEAMPRAAIHLAAAGDGLSLPRPDSWVLSSDSAYCHFTSNETADGLQFHTLPDRTPIPLVADMSADFLTRPLPVERFGLIYASAQKNLGSAGLTIVVVRADLLDRGAPATPAPLDYARQVREASKVNTPPTLAIAIAARMLRWIVEQGGLENADRRSRARSTKLYAAIDVDDFYTSPVITTDRSNVSVRFHLANPGLETLFRAEAEAEGLLHLGGHPAVGGLRASLYNGIGDDAVDALLSFMGEFRRRRG